ncbi:MAG: hypothetical protein Kow0037_29290 [Calditrichia bacterium]
MRIFKTVLRNMQKKVLVLFTLALFSLMPGIVSGQVLNPGDGVRVTFFNISDKISGDYFVQPDTTLQLPYLGQLPVANRPFPELKQEIMSKYGELYRDPELVVQPLFKIKILGEVKRPGIYFATGVERLTDLLALAGGQTDEADLKKIYFIVNGERLQIDAYEMLKEGRVLGDIGLRSGTQVYIPKKWLNLRRVSVIFSGIAVTATVVSLLLR